MKKRKIWVVRALAGCVLAHGCMILAAVPEPTVKTTQGEAAGKWIEGGTERAFLGLPYAAPPVGELRWKAPQTPSGWKGVRDATKFAARCEQWHIWNDYLFLDSGPSEDCLYLNIWTAAKSPKANLPVMVWIHGGGFTRGYASSRAYDGETLARKGVVVVSINYRLGIFGFFAHPELTAESKHHASGCRALDKGSIERR